MEKAISDDQKAWTIKHGKKIMIKFLENRLIKNKINSLLFCFSICGIFIVSNSNSYNAYCFGQEGNNTYVTDYNIGRELSSDTGLKLVVIFSSEWCINCQNLKNDLPSIRNFDNKIICVLEVEENKDLSEKFKVKNLPTSIVLDASGKEVSKIIGYNKLSYENWLKNK